MDTDIKTSFSSFLKKKNFVEIQTQKDLPWTIKLALFFSGSLYETNPQKDDILLKIVSFPQEITHIYIPDRYYIDFFFKNGEAIKFWNVNRYYSWGNPLEIYKYINNKWIYKKTIDGCPSKRVKKLFAKFCYQRGLL